MLPAQKPHLSCVRNAGAESLRFSEAKQIYSVATLLHSTDRPAGAYCTFEAEAVGLDSCRFEAGKHHAGGSAEATLSRESDRFRQRVLCVKDRGEYVFAVPILQVMVFK